MPVDLDIRKVKALKRKGELKGQISHQLADAWNCTTKAEFIPLKVLDSC